MSRNKWKFQKQRKPADGGSLKGPKTGNQVSRNIQDPGERSCPGPPGVTMTTMSEDGDQNLGHAKNSPC